jgi:hypothetical protein
MNAVSMSEKNPMTRSFESSRVCDKSTNFASNMTNSFISHESPAQNFMFDLTSDLTDLATDSNEFNDFFKNDNQYSKIERPQNPFYKNFQSYQ